MTDDVAGFYLAGEKNVNFVGMIAKPNTIIIIGL